MTRVPEEEDVARRPASHETAGARRRQGGMFEPSIHFLHIRGIPIGAHWSWLFVFALIVWTLAAVIFPAAYPGLTPATYWWMGSIAAVLFFGSILLHELGHALTAIREGMRIEGITLWLFGGVARFTSMFPSAAAEFKIAIAGPVVTLVLVGVFAVLTWAGGQANLPDAVVGVLDYLARINLIVLGFNLVPALPLDGGRVLRAWLWHRQESFEAATRSAALAGRAFGGLLIGVGLLGFFTGAATGGLWIAFIGWFLLQAAQAEAAQAMIRAAFRGLRVRDVMTPDPIVVSREMRLDELLDRAAGPRGHATYPVVEDGALAGFVSARAAAGIPPEERSRTPVSQVMLKGAEVPVLAADDEVMDALEVLQQGGLGRAVVLDREQQPVGVVALSDVARSLELRQLRGVEEPPARPAGLLIWVVVAAILLGAAGALYHPPLAVVAPGPAEDVSAGIQIAGVPAERPNGEYLLTAVVLYQPSSLGALVAIFHPDRDVVRLAAVIPPGEDPERFVGRQRELFEQSRMLAAAAAAREVGLEVTVEGSGARVVSVLPDSPASAEIRAGDVIVAVDGAEVTLASQLVEQVRARPVGSEFRLTVERDGVTREVTLRSTLLRGPLQEEVAAMGILVETRDFSIQLPFEISFARNEMEVGGPSAGLAYALAILDMLDPADLAAGRRIAATGTIDVSGHVGRVGGVKQKAALVHDRADIFFVPSGEVEDAMREALTVQGVDTLSEALAELRAST